MRIERITRFPVKGLSPELLEEVMLEAAEGLPGDRRFAFAQGDSPFDPADPKWLPKRNFACLAVNARAAAVHAAFDPRTNTLALRAEGQPPLLADLSAEAGRQAAAEWITAFLGEEARGALRLAEVPGHAFTDIPQKAVSLIGMASVADLGARAGMVLDPLRFRGNILFSGAAAFAELDWVGREILLGGARLRVFKRTQRCAATEVNPGTAERDALVPRWLRQHYGHADMGVYAEVLEGGRIAVGDALELLD
ncbi:MOSC domain-containing protein [Falsiroseomonas oryziterrae]|uniref:MOSC domain-containing protein n=1 Tax=Falsiroseomonas oryziterrae TaxID=2911368 RepID=UPI001F029266|nr:MOSC domain-containing protein [Roseomonas sp. NPKOSM-4]